MDNQIFAAITGNTVSNSIITIPDGWQSITLLNAGDADATVTFSDGSITLLRANGGTLSIGIYPVSYKGVVVTASSTTIDYVVTGVSRHSITIA